MWYRNLISQFEKELCAQSEFPVLFYLTDFLKDPRTLSPTLLSHTTQTSTKMTQTPTQERNDAQERNDETFIFREQTKLEGVHSDEDEQPKHIRRSSSGSIVETIVDKFAALANLPTVADTDETNEKRVAAREATAREAASEAAVRSQGEKDDDMQVRLSSVISEVALKCNDAVTQLKKRYNRTTLICPHCIKNSVKTILHAPEEGDRLFLCPACGGVIEVGAMGRVTGFIVGKVVLGVAVETAVMVGMEKQSTT